MIRLATAVKRCILSCLHALQEDQTAMLLFASYKCAQRTYGVKLIGTAKRMPGIDPRAGQVAAVDIAPSSGTVQQPAVGRKLTAGKGAPW